MFEISTKDLALKRTKDNLKFMKTTHFGICQVSIAPIRAAASDESEIVTQLLFGDYVQIKEEGKPWIKIYFSKDDYEGYMDFKQLAYVSKEEFESDSAINHKVVNNGVLSINGPLGLQQLIAGSCLPNYSNGKFSFANANYSLNEPLQELTDTFVQTALRYLNSPYLWGGKGIFGIDCSGFTQIVAKIHGKELPRDASRQVKTGTSIDYSDRKIGDLMYFINTKGIVHHVGIITAINEVIHASGHVRIDTFDEHGISRPDMEGYTHHYHSIKRI